MGDMANNCALTIQFGVDMFMNVDIVVRGIEYWGFVLGVVMVPLLSFVGCPEEKACYED